MTDSRPEKPEQAAPEQPHWVVVSLSAGATPQEIARSGKSHWRRLFRHPTEASANAECARLAAAAPGTTFRVYASGITAHVAAQVMESAV